MNRDQINKELEAMGSLLAYKTTEEKFDVPNGYFEDFEQSIIAELLAKTPESAKRISLFSYLKYAVAAALIVSLGVYVFDNPAEPILENDIDYVLEDINGIDEELLFDIEDLDDFNDFSSAEIPEESIVEFLDLYIDEIDHEYLAILE